MVLHDHVYCFNPNYIKHPKPHILAELQYIISAIYEYTIFIVQYINLYTKYFQYFNIAYLKCIIIIH